MCIESKKIQYEFTRLKMIRVLMSQNDTSYNFYSSQNDTSSDFTRLKMIRGVILTRIKMGILLKSSVKEIFF